MKRLLITVLLLTSISGFTQQLNNTASIQNFIKVWGLLKYYHPVVAKGEFDWDSVFVNKIQAIITTNPNDFNKQLSDIMNFPFDSTKVAEQKNDDSLFQMNKTNIDWINRSSLFNSTIKKELIAIYNNGNSAANKYISIINNTADFSRENPFENIGFPDVNYRLLFLSRCWNIINYFAPYKYLTTNWDDVLLKFIPKVMQSKDSLSYYKSLQEFCKSLNDGHSQLALNGQMLPDLYFGNYTVPFYCEIIDEQVVIRNTGSDSIAKSLNIQKGDIILSIDDEDISKVINNKKRYISASNTADENHQLSRFILDGLTSKAMLKIKRGKNIIKTTIGRTSTQNRDWGAFINYTSNDVGYKKLNDTVLLIYAMQIWNGNIDTIRHLITQSKAVIFDVRNYPQNDAFYAIPYPFLSEPKSIDYSTVAIPERPGLFKWELNPNKMGNFSNSAFKGKVMILCDARTQSQGEYSCMVLQTIPGAVTIGSQTAGADGIVTNIPMGGGLTISYSGYGVYYPDKTQTQRKGVKIDVMVKQTIEAIKSGKDEILDRALLYIKNGN